MKSSALAVYWCPNCRSNGLVLREQQPVALSNEIDRGMLSCLRCNAAYPVRDRVPRFVGGEEYAGSFGFQWNKFRRTQLDSHVGLPLSAERLFRVTHWPRSMPGSRVLEAGSGAGRFTEVLLATGATVFSFDLSNAVDANLTNNGHLSNLNLFQASILDIPVCEAIFDKVICLGVLQHTPDPEKAFFSLARYVKPGGDIAIDIYALRLTSLISWKYLLRPITKRISKEHLFRWVERVVNVLLPTAIVLRRIGGAWGARLLPIVEYSHLDLTLEVNREWATLDTFDMYSPVHDHPRSIRDVQRWFDAAGFEDVVVEYGPNGVIARGRRPLQPIVALGRTGDGIQSSTVDFRLQAEGER